jgi:hypothetical protein
MPSLAPLPEFITKDGGERCYPAQVNWNLMYTPFKQITTRSTLKEECTPLAPGTFTIDEVRFVFC